MPLSHAKIRTRSSSILRLPYCKQCEQWKSMMVFSAMAMVYASSLKMIHYALLFGCAQPAFEQCVATASPHTSTPFGGGHASTKTLLSHSSQDVRARASLMSDHGTSLWPRNLADSSADFCSSLRIFRLCALICGLLRLVVCLSLIHYVIHRRRA